MEQRVTLKGGNTFILDTSDDRGYKDEWESPLEECSSSEACEIVEHILNGNELATSISYLVFEKGNPLWLEQVLDYSLQGKKIQFKIFKWEFIIYYKRKEKMIWQ